MIEKQLQSLAAETQRADKYEQLAREQGQKLVELERTRNALTRERDHLSVTLNENVAILEEKSVRLNHLDAVVEEVRPAFFS